MKNEVTDAAIADYDRRNKLWEERRRNLKTVCLPKNHGDIPLKLKMFLEQM
jgi:hypothetical protein